MSSDGQFIEFQATGEESKFSKETILSFIELVEGSMQNLQNSKISN